MSQPYTCNIQGLSEQLGLSVKQIRALVAKKRVPYLRLGHRTLVFVPEKVKAALARYEVKEVGAARS